MFIDPPRQQHGILPHASLLFSYEIQIRLIRNQCQTLIDDLVIINLQIDNWTKVMTRALLKLYKIVHKNPPGPSERWATAPPHRPLIVPPLPSHAPQIYELQLTFVACCPHPTGVALAWPRDRITGCVVRTRASLLTTESVIPRRTVCEVMLFYRL